MFWYLKPACSFRFLISEPSYMTSQLCTACCEDSLRVVQRDDFPTWSVTFFPSQNPFWPLSFFLFLSFLINHLVFWDVYHDSFIIVCLSCFVSLECTDISSVTTLLSLLTILFFFFFSLTRLEKPWKEALFYTILDGYSTSGQGLYLLQGFWLYYYLFQVFTSAEAFFRSLCLRLFMVDERRGS